MTEIRIPELNEVCIEGKNPIIPDAKIDVASPTSLCFLSGAYILVDINSYHDLKCLYLLSDEYKNQPTQYSQDLYTDDLMSAYTPKNIGIRLVTDTSIINSSVTPVPYYDNDYKCQAILYGYYPQSALDPEIYDDTIQKLEDMYQKQIGRTGNKYTLNCNDDFMGFVPKEYPEYELDNERYIRFITPTCPTDESSIDWINKHYFKKGEVRWIKVKPIEWLLNEETGKMISKKALLSGMPVTDNNVYDGNFKTTFLYNYLNTCFAEEMVQQYGTKISVHSNINSVTDFKEIMIQSLQKDAQTIYQNNRLQFYQDIFKLAKDYTQSIKDNQNLKDEILKYAKDFVVQMTQNPDLTPTMALSKLTDEINKEQGKENNPTQNQTNNTDKFQKNSTSRLMQFIRNTFNQKNKREKRKEKMTDIIIPAENDVKLYKGLSIISQTDTSGYAIGSDLSFLLGITPHDYIKNIERHYEYYPNKTVPYLLSSVKENGYNNQTFAANAYTCGYAISLNEDAKKYGIRPMTDKSIIPPSMEIKSRFSKQYNCTIIEYGFYPQSAVNPRTEAEIIQQLNEMYEKKEGKTGNVYTFNKHPVVDSYGCTHPAKKFLPWKHFEYELNGNRYVRVQSKVDNRFIGNHKDEKYWIKVEPIEWLLDEETGKMIARRALLSGISIIATNGDYNGNFKQTQLYQYLNTYFAEEMNQNNHLCTYNKDLLMSNFQQDFEKEIVLPNESTYQDNRIGFYNEVFKYAKKYTERIKDNQEDQNKIIMFAKNFVIQLSRNPELSLSDAFEIVKQKSNTEETQAQTQAQTQMQTQAYSDIRNLNLER